MINGNLLTSPCKVIAHQVNCQGVMGGGIARQIKNRWPQVYADYYKDYKSGNLVLGYLCGTWVGDSLVADGRRYVANLCGQDKSGSIIPFSRLTDYAALESALKSLVKHYGKYAPIGMPYGIGCGIAKGKWKIVYDIIETVFKDNECHLYRL